MFKFLSPVLNKASIKLYINIPEEMGLTSRSGVIENFIYRPAKKGDEGAPQAQ
jgi:hypothetical protein